MSDIALAPEVSHTGSVGLGDAVFDKGYFDNLSNSTRTVAVADIMGAEDKTRIAGEISGLGTTKADKTDVTTEATNRAKADGELQTQVDAKMPAAPADGKNYVASGTAWKEATASGGGANPPQFLMATDKRQLTIKTGTVLRRQDGTTFTASTPTIIDLDFVPAKGKDYYVHLTNTGTFTVSTTKANASAVLIGGFHALCANVATGLTYMEGGVSTPHSLAGYVAGDILPHSVWCLNHRPHSEPEGMVYIPTIGFWCDIYLTSGTGTATKSAYQGTISRTRQIGDFIEDFFLVNKTLLDDSEFAAAMLGSNEQTSVAGASEAGATTGGAGGRSDTAGRRMISVYGVEEGCGSLWQFLRHATTGGSAAWATQSGGKGQFYQCNVVIAGGAWSNGASCGSRARPANGARSYSNASLGGRGRSRHVGS